MNNQRQNKKNIYHPLVGSARSSDCEMPRVNGTS